jgi:hypothetical protein
MPFTFSIAEYTGMVLRKVLMLVIEFMPQRNTSNMPQTVQYQTEECLLKFTSIARHHICITAACEFNQDLDEQSNIVWTVQRSPHTTINIQRTARHLYVPPYERMENTAHTGHIPIPNASWTR